MLIAFLIRDEADWREWKARMSNVDGKSIVHISDYQTSTHGSGSEREGALDEVQTFDDEQDDDEIMEVNHPSSGDAE